MSTPETFHHATTDHTFSPDECVFLRAMERFQQRTGKRFPTFCETLGVARELGYTQHERPIRTGAPASSWLDPVIPR